MSSNELVDMLDYLVNRRDSLTAGEQRSLEEIISSASRIGITAGHITVIKRICRDLDERDEERPE